MARFIFQDVSSLYFNHKIDEKMFNFSILLRALSGGKLRQRKLLKQPLDFEVLPSVAGGAARSHLY